jgi:predicted aspartyl protease
MSVLFLLVSGEIAELSAAEQSRAIPFKLYGGFAIVIRGAIADQEKLNLLVDTGAVPSAIHQRLARKLNLNGPKEKHSVITNIHFVERVTIPQMRVGPLEISSVSAVVVDLTAIERRLGLRLDAIIGLDVLGAQAFTIDYRVRQILLGQAGKTDEAIPFELLTQDDAPYVVVALQINSHSVRLLMDTGADGITLFDSWVRRPPFAVQRFGARSAISAGGEYTVEQIELLDVRLGTAKRGMRRATLVESTMPGSVNFDGLLGPTSLGITRLAFDFSARVLYLQIER